MIGHGQVHSNNAAFHPGLSKWAIRSLRLSREGRCETGPWKDVCVSFGAVAIRESRQRPRVFLRQGCSWAIFGNLLVTVLNSKPWERLMGKTSQLITRNRHSGRQTEAGCRVIFVSKRYLSQPHPFFLSSRTATSTQPASHDHYFGCPAHQSSKVH